MSGTHSAWLSSVTTILEVLALDAGAGSLEAVLAHSAHGGADVVLEVAGSEDTFRHGLGVRQAQCGGDGGGPLRPARRLLPLPDMYGKNLTFKTGGVDGCNCAQTLDLIAAGQAGHHAPHHPHLPSQGHRRGLPALRVPAGGRHQGGHPALTPPQPSYAQIAPQGAGGTLWIP